MRGLFRLWYSTYLTRAGNPGYRWLRPGTSSPPIAESPRQRLKARQQAGEHHPAAGPEASLRTRRTNDKGARFAPLPATTEVLPRKGKVGWNHEYVLVPTAGEAVREFHMLDCELWILDCRPAFTPGRFDLCLTDGSFERATTGGRLVAALR